MQYLKVHDTIMSTQIRVAYNQNQSPVSTFLKILIKMCLIPVTVNPSERTVTFKLRSKSTLIFMLYNIILLGGSYGLLLYTDGITTLVMWFQAKMQELNPVDFVSLVCRVYLLVHIRYPTITSTFQNR